MFKLIASEHLHFDNALQLSSPTSVDPSAYLCDLWLVTYLVPGSRISSLEHGGLALTALQGYFGSVVAEFEVQNLTHFPSLSLAASVS